MNHLDLFSGIGGFGLAARWAGLKTSAFCEIDSYCQKVLNKHWPDVPIYDDIRELGKERLENDGISTDVDFLTGGFPCQPFSVAGKQRGKDDNRHLWPEMLRLISEIRPNWVIGENVSGFVSLALDDCLADLESQGYETETFVIPACAVNAPHRRDRVWIVAHANSQGEPVGPKYEQRMGGNSQHSENVANSRRQLRARAEFSRANGLENTVADSSRQRRPVRVSVPRERQEGKSKELVNNSDRQRGWTGSNNWATEPDVGRVADGIPSRVDRLKGLGNAVVPQIPYQLMMMIKQLNPAIRGQYSGYGQG